MPSRVLAIFSRKKKPAVVEVGKPANGGTVAASEPPPPSNAKAAPEPAAPAVPAAQPDPKSLPEPAAPAVPAAGPESKAVAPASDSSTPPPAPPADDASTEEPEEQVYELEVPPNAQPGSKLKLTIPGLTEKVVITVPEGADPGRTITFTLPKNKSEVDAKLVTQTKAATAIQARIRGKAARQVTRTQMEIQKSSSASIVAEEPTPPVPDEPKPPVPDEPKIAAPTVAEAEYTPNFPTEPPPPPPAREEEPGFFGGLLRSMSSLFGGGAPEPPVPEPAVEAQSAAAFELSGLAAKAVAAWEASDFDAFAALADPEVTISLPGVNASGMTGVWAARHADDVEGILSVDTVMVQVDEDGQTAIVGAIEHAHDNQAHGMPLQHRWLRIGFRMGGADGATWKLTELMRDPVWPLPPPSSGASASAEEFRLGQGRTLGGCTDVASLTAVALTSWVAGDRNRFELAVAPDVSIQFQALGIRASGVAAAWEGRSNLLNIGTLVSVNSPMGYTDGRGNASVLAHAHLYDVAASESSGRPTAHFALRLDFSGSTLSSLVGDVIWMDEDKVADEYETEGLAFDNPPVQSIYTRALTFLKAWETQADDSMRALTVPTVALAVDRYKVSGSDIEALLSYRATLQTVGMLTVDSVRVSDTKFEACMHEYGVDVAQHGLPRMHAGLTLEFVLDEASREMKISRMEIDVEYAPVARRQSSFKDVGAEVQLSQEL